MYAWQFAQYLALAERRGWSRFVTMQNHYNLLYREEEREMLPLCRKEGIGVIPWSPLARGLLTRPRQEMDASLRSKTDNVGRNLYKRDESDGAIIDAVGMIAKKRGVPYAQVALAWILAQPGVTAPIIGASKVSHLEDAVAALDISLDAQEIAALTSPYLPRPIMGH
jgi:aryl-alcohol dehydrogenase (NADP+)